MKHTAIPYFEKMQKDFRGYSNARLNRRNAYITCIISTFITKFQLLRKNVTVGKHPSFYGLPYFYRTPESTITIGDHCVFRSLATSNLIGINHRCILSTHNKGAVIRIGDRSGFSGVTIAAAKQIIIKNGVLVGANAIISDFDWHMGRGVYSDPKPIVIEDNVIIGVNSVIWKGVSIGRNSVIGAMSVVTKNVPENCVAAGNPIRILRKLNLP
jgi:acetyltransferase-like isoleucine patch superfamily enzyme